MEKSLTHIALFAALIAALGLMPSMMLATGVPISGQSLGIMLCGTVLGAKRGGLAALLFIALVAAGLPLLAGGVGGLGMFFGPRGGFLIGFPVAAFVTGLIVQNLRARIGIAAFAGAVLGGIVVLYAIGVPVMAAHLSEESLAKMFADLPAYRELPLPVALCALFLPGDIIKAVIAAAVTATVARMRPASLLSRA